MCSSLRTTLFKLNHLRLLIVLRVVYALVFGLVQARLILYVDQSHQLPVLLNTCSERL